MPDEKVSKLEFRNHMDAAMSFHRQGFACSQAILAAYAPDFGIDTETALRMSTPFAGGIARSGEICGVITGALMVIGLRYGKYIPDNNEAKEITYYYTEEFIAAFRERRKYVLCRDLIDCNLNTPDGLKRFIEDKISKSICMEFVRDGVDILDQMI